MPIATLRASPIAQRARVIAFWFFTLVIVWEMLAGAFWDLLQIEFVRGVFDQLGYPHYLLLIIGAWKLPCAVVLMLPRFPRLKEWAYAGAVFNYTGAAASHLFTGHGPEKWVGPALFAVMTLSSWALRAPERKLATSTLEPAPPRAWLIPAAILVVLAVIALLTLPQGPPPA